MDIDDGPTTNTNDGPTTNTNTNTTAATTTAGGASSVPPPEFPFKVHFADESDINAKIALSSANLRRVQGAVREKLVEAQELLMRNNDVIKG